MKAILMSIKPKCCEKIFSGKMTIKVCKTAIEPPFKEYVYCTKERMTRVPSMYAYLHKNEPRACAEYGTIETWGEIGDVIVNPHLDSKHVSFGMHGKVIGEFVCDRADDYAYDYSDGVDIDDDSLLETCFERDEINIYANGKKIRGLHITEPKLYDKPKELGAFIKICPMKNPDCAKCEWYSEYSNTCTNYVTRPPKSWCYVGEVVE